jgi:hypothetical protein
MGKRMFEQEEEEEEKYEKDEAAEDEGLEFFRLLLVFIMMPLYIVYRNLFFYCVLFSSPLFFWPIDSIKRRETHKVDFVTDTTSQKVKRDPPPPPSLPSIHPAAAAFYFSKSKVSVSKNRRMKKKRIERESVCLQLLGCAV